MKTKATLLYVFINKLIGFQYEQQFGRCYQDNCLWKVETSKKHFRLFMQMTPISISAVEYHLPRDLFEICVGINYMTIDFKHIY